MRIFICWVGFNKQLYCVDIGHILRECSWKRKSIFTLLVIFWIFTRKFSEERKVNTIKHYCIKIQVCSRSGDRKNGEHHPKEVPIHPGSTKAVNLRGNHDFALKVGHFSFTGCPNEDGNWETIWISSLISKNWLMLLSASKRD